MPKKREAIASAAGPSAPTPAVPEAQWHLPKKAAGTAQTSKAHVLANAPTARIVRVCYLKGPADSFVSARGITSGKANVTTSIHLGGCADIGGTDVELTNHNATSVSGTYLVVE